MRCPMCGSECINVYYEEPEWWTIECQDTECLYFQTIDIYNVLDIIFPRWCK